MAWDDMDKPATSKHAKSWFFFIGRFVLDIFFGVREKLFGLSVKTQQICDIILGIANYLLSFYDY
ncbi:MAG: hypothetical protein MR971_00110 [Bacteroidales bacterium]|nr:hypothetical protein [Bacteroidales bacterium]